MEQQLGNLLLEACGDARTVETLRWVGLAAFSAAVVVLLWTRWGSSQVLAKCVALSVFAHLLLAFYFWSTESSSDPPGLGGGERYVRVALTTETSETAQLVEPEKPLTTELTPPQPSDTPSSADSDSPVSDETTAPPQVVAAERASAPEREPEPAPSQAPSVPRATPAVPTTPPTVATLAEAPQSSDAPDALAHPQERLVASSPAVAPAEAPQTPSWVAPEAPSEPRQRTELAATTSPAAGARFASTAAPRIVPATQVPAVYRDRIREDRLERVIRGGGNERTEAAVAAALAWLAARQQRDGRWDPLRHGGGRDERAEGQERPGAGAKADTGITALALLAFLGAGHTHFDGEYREHVQHGLEYLLGQQRADGSLAGEASTYSAMYCHGMATLALSEAYAMTGDQRMRPFVERAVRYTIAAQHPTLGGWRYKPGDLGDMSQFGWQVMSLKSAATAGIEAPPHVRTGMERFLQHCSTGARGGLASYRPRERVTAAMTAEALACRLFLGAPKEAPAVQEGATFLLGALPRRDEQPNLYYWYYGTLAMYQVRGEPWRQWNAAMQEVLLASQESAGAEAGSWNTDSLWASYGGRVFTTSLAALCLESYYRFAPLDEAAAEEQGPVALAPGIAPLPR